MKMLSDTETELSLIKNLFQHGFDAYHEICTLGISENSFVHINNKVIFSCLKSLFEDKQVQRPDIALIYEAGKAIGVSEFLKEPETKQYINDLGAPKVNLEGAKLMAQKLRKLEIANNINEAADDIKNEVAGLNGEERLADIFGIVESKLGDLASFLTDTSEEPIDFAEHIDGHLKDLETNQVDQLGIPTGFDIFDKYIGGGLRKHAITVIAARPKTGKSMMCSNIAWNVARQGIPILYLDTEMQSTDQMNRLLASVSGVQISNIEAGKFKEDIFDEQKIVDAAEEIKKVKFKYKNISGMPLESQLAIVRKWIIKDVGLTKDGRAKDCLLVYDYIKIMDSREIVKTQEYQAIGFLVTALQNFAVKYDIPILTAAQLNRDGISVEDTSAIGSSDRIAMYASSISLLKWKTIEELSMENHMWGNQKLVPIVSRYGPPMDIGSYINITFDTSKSKMEEKGLSKTSQMASNNSRRQNKKKEPDVEDVEF